MKKAREWRDEEGKWRGEMKKAEGHDEEWLQETRHVCLMRDTERYGMM